MTDSDDWAAGLSRPPKKPMKRGTKIFLWAFARKPSQADLDAALAHIHKHEKNKRVAYENLIWAVMNTKEFVFNQ